MKLFNILVHLLAETNRHAGHADILREQLDDKPASAANDSRGGNAQFWLDHCATIERAAKAATQGDESAA